MEIIKVLESNTILNNILTQKQINYLFNFIKNLNDKDKKLLYYNIDKKINKNKILSNKQLNLNGLYLSRTIFAEEYIKSKIQKYNNNNFFNEYMNKGYLVIENFLLDDEFLKLKNELDILIKEKYKNNEDGLTKIFSNNFTKEIINFYNNKKLIELLLFCSFSLNEKDIINNKRNYIEILTHIDNDIQKVWHVDTHHFTCKWWFYTDDILDTNLGPLEYIEGSHLNTINKLKYEYNLINDLLNNPKKCKPSIQGSFRYYNDENIKNIGYDVSKFKKMLFKKNTLIITNNRGIHRRGLGKIGMKRISLSSSLRLNIF